MVVWAWVKKETVAGRWEGERDGEKKVSPTGEVGRWLGLGEGS